MLSWPWLTAKCPPSCSLTPLSQERLGEYRRKVRRFMDWDNDILIRKAKAVHASKAKIGINSLLPISRQVSSYFLESRTSACVALAWEDKRHNREYNSFLLCSLRDCCCHMVWNIPLVSAGVPAMEPLSLMPTPSLFIGHDAGQSGLKRCCCCASPAQQWWECQRVINTISATDTKHSTVWLL